MTDVDLDTQDEQLVGIPAGALCAKCEAPHSAIGGRKDGQFIPLFQVKPDRAAAVKKIGGLWYCGRGSREHMLRIKRIVCKPVEAEDGITELLCQLCARKIAIARAEGGGTL